MAMASIHHYLEEGMDRDQFTTALHDLIYLKEEYEDAAKGH
jgi:hypothetical protein